MKKWTKYSLTLALLCAVFFSACFVPEWIGMYKDRSYMGKVQEYQDDNAFTMYEQAEGKEENWNLMKRLQQSDNEVLLESDSVPVEDNGLIRERFLQELRSVGNMYEKVEIGEFLVQECELKYNLQDGMQGSRSCYRIYADGVSGNEFITALIDKETYGIYYFDSIMREQANELVMQLIKEYDVSGEEISVEEIYNQVFQAKGLGQKYEEGILKYYNDMINIKKAYGENGADDRKADYVLEIIMMEGKIPAGFQGGFLGFGEMIEEFDIEYGYQWSLMVEELLGSKIWNAWNESTATDGGVIDETEQKTE